MLAATYEGRTWYRPQLVRATIMLATICEGYSSCWPQFARIAVLAGRNLSGYEGCPLLAPGSPHLNVAARTGIIKPYREHVVLSRFS